MQEKNEYLVVFSMKNCRNLEGLTRLRWLTCWNYGDFQEKGAESYKLLTKA